MNPLDLDIGPFTLTIIAFIFFAIFVAMLIRLDRTYHYLRNRRKNLTERIEDLELGKMLSYLGISINRYFRSTTDLQKERHILACEGCPNPVQCLKAFAGEKIDVATICPNLPQLKKVRRNQSIK